ncbi:class I SAM-dependent methyltransferase [Schleiferilactobacillus harbinensis]|jgi:2-polyprenyl-3-methyl-5-hydroxy-6-metoxy-1,4-benzoquinol methylase|uniref:class I SAM-dependent methyltransferase n=1 Tax=Schleiferilactobacillus harbinensis TaxID=304207 RepID=UPI00242E50F7|nr:class I SAM-dependent methyltransferase [Schleiferilactobacillus harbinensis]MCI1688030.1 class I SAM-dependent methyltransferase [Schleiferilactobacillus harbinensis]MCI1782426.1 class I SAM-dependent methyltransferase [Schleiferilactobacillus harbinensis]MCI1850704.1 class I SAM-dependent methyltransferase [Schleiferilactobacillus harbinensis]
MQQADRLPLVPDMAHWLLTEKILPAGRVLDLGSGSGRFSPMLARHAQTLTLMDISAQMLQYAQQALQAAGQHAQTVIRAPWTEFARRDQQYEVIFAHMAPFLTPADMPRLARLLAPAGTFVLSRVSGRTDLIFDQFIRAFPELKAHYVSETEQPLTQWQQKSRQAGWAQRQTSFNYQYTEEIDRDYLTEELPPLLNAAHQQAFQALIDRLFGATATQVTQKTLTVGVTAFTPPAADRRS